MVIKINYTSSDVYVSTSVSPVYVVVNYSAVNNGGGAIWGGITGTLSDQTDLQTALNSKFDDPTGTTSQYLRGDGSLATFPTIPSGTVTSVGLTMPSAFAVANSPITSSGTLAVTGAGTSAQYVRGDGQLANFPTNGGGGSSVNYYLNGSVNQGTFGGDTYYEMSKTPIIGTGTNFTRTNAQGNGYIASFITDAGDPALLNIPGGNWNVEFYFAASSGGGTPSFYAELYKVSSSNVFTLISSGSTNPEGITQGTVIDQYFTSIPVPQTSLLATDRLAIRIFVTPSGRTITLHTEDNNLCEVLTTFSTGLNALNGLTSQVQYFATGTSGTDFAISSATDTHTFNLPTASATNRGALSSADWSTFNNKVPPSRTLTINGTAFDLSADRSWTIAAGITGSGVANQLTYWNGTGSVTGSAGLVYNDSTGLMTLSKNQNAAMGFLVQNTNSGSSSTAEINMISDGGRIFAIFKKSSTATPFKIMLSSDASLYNSGAGDISMLNDVAAGKIKFTAGAAGVAQMTLTAAGRLLLGTTTESTFILDAVGSVKFGTAGTGTGMYWDNANNRLGIGIATPTRPLSITFNANDGNGLLYLNNPNTGSAANAGLVLQATTASGSVFATSSTYSTYGILTANMVGFYANSTFGIAVQSGDFIIGTANELFPKFRLFGNTGNVLIQNGGTFTDAGFRLDVNGTARVSGLLRGDANAQLRGVYPYLELRPDGWSGGQTYIQAGLNLVGSNVGDYTLFTTPANKGYAFYSGTTIPLLVETTTGNIGLNTSSTSGYRLYVNRGSSATGALAVVGGVTDFAGSTTSYASLRINSGVAPTSPTNGEIWFDGTDLKMRIGGVTKTFTLV